MKNERNKSGITDPLFETDGYIKEFTATVIDCVELDGSVSEGEDGHKIYGLVLDKTAFFPEGGGQQADRGVIDGQDVLDVQIDDNGTILHYVASPIEKDTFVTGTIDFDLRLRRMQNHGAEHILSGLIFRKFGYDNVGFHMSDGEVRFDTNGPLTDDDIAEIEREANLIVYSNVPITIGFPTEEEARTLTYRSKLDVYENIRLVTIEGVDTCACCAPHLSSSGQIGIIKIVSAIPHRQGMRITMVAGLDAYEDYLMLHNDNAQIMALLSSKREKTVQFTQDLLDRNFKLRGEISRLKGELSSIVSNSFMEEISKKQPDDNSSELIFTQILDNNGLRELINQGTKSYSGIIAGFTGNDEEGYKYIAGCAGEEDLRELAKEMNQKLSGRGGGSSVMIQGSVCANESAIRRFFDNK